MNEIMAGFHEKMSEDDYFALPFASNSSLGMLLDRSPLHSRHAYQSLPTPALAFGRLFHLMLLQPDLAEHTIAVRPQDANKASNSGKRSLLAWMERTSGIESTAGAELAEGKMLSARIAELETEMSGFTVCSADDYDRARAMLDAVMSRSICRVIFDRGKSEMTMLALEPTFNVVCKARADWIPADQHMLVDLKTTQNASWYAFSRDCARYGYHRQAALYKRLHALLTGESQPSFVHVVVESEPPHDVGIYELDAEAIAAGNRDIDFALRICAQCEASGIWPGAGWDWIEKEYRIETLSLPKWAL